MARLQERLDLLAQAAQAAPVPAVPAAPSPAAEPPAPDPLKDPMGYVQWGLDRLNAQIARQNERVAEVERFAQQGQAQTAQQQQVQQLIAWGQADEARFASTQPDYPKATAFLRDSRARELQAAGITSPMEIQQTIAQDTLMLAQRARQQGVSLGHMIYNLASARGYQGDAGVPANGAPAVPAPPDPAAAMARTTRGAAMAPGLPAGGAPRVEPSAQALANMSDEQFDAHLAKVRKDPAAMRALFGE